VQYSGELKSEKEPQSSYHSTSLPAMTEKDIADGLCHLDKKVTGLHFLCKKTPQDLKKDLQNQLLNILIIKNSIVAKIEMPEALGKHDKIVVCMP
jgi:pyruvate kinase